MATGPFSLLLFAGPPHTHTTRRKKMMRNGETLVISISCSFFPFVYMWTPPKDDGQESSWPLNDVMAVECQLSPFSVSPTALMADSLSSCDPAQHRHFLFFYHRRAMYIRWKKRKKMPRAILRFITLSQTDQRSFCTHPPAIQCLCSDVLGATQNHFDVFQSVNKETMVVPPFARLSRKQNRQRAAGPLAGREETLAVV